MITIKTTGEAARVYNTPAYSLTDIRQAFKQFISESQPQESERSYIWRIVCEFADNLMIEYLIKELNWSVNQLEMSEPTLLHVLAERGKASYFNMPKDRIYRSVTFLLEAKVSTLKKDSANETSLMIAAKEGMDEFLQAYIDKGVRITGTTNDGDNLLHIVAEYGGRAEQSFVYAQQKYDKEMASTDYDPNRSYMKERREQLINDYEREVARQQGFINFAKLLLAQGYDPEEKNNYGKTAIDIAVKYKAKQIGAVLSGVDPDDPQSALSLQAGGSNLYQACINQDSQALEALLKLGANTNLAYDCPNDRFDGFLPLSISVVLKNVEAVKLLLQYNANPNLLDAKGCHPLSYYHSIESKINTHFDIFKNKVIQQTLDAFIQAGFDINSSIDEQENTLLNLSAAAFNASSKYNSMSTAGVLIEYLIDKGADINCSNQAGVTPLMSLCCSDDSETENMVILLLENNADVTAKDIQGKTPLIYTAQNRNGSMARNFAELLIQFDDPLIATQDNMGKSAIDYAAEHNHESLLNWLLIQ